MIQAPSIFNVYGGSGFPALSDAIYLALENTNSTNRGNYWNEVRKQLSIVIYVIQSASYILDEPASFEREFK